ncbi:hypothetical protein ACROYT_G005774, partial [Oculina patagonica]
SSQWSVSSLWSSSKFTFRILCFLQWSHLSFYRIYLRLNVCIARWISRDFAFCDYNLFAMSSMYIPLITAFGLVGVFFNLQMLLTCFRNKTKYTFLQNIWAFVICQFVYHVSVLVMNTVDAWTKLDVQQGEYCSTIYLLISTFMTFFAGGNLMAILVIESRNTMPYQSRELFPTCGLFTTAALALGFAVSVILRYACFCEQFVFHVMVISVIIVVTIVVLLLVASGSTLQVDNTTPKRSMPKTSLPIRFKKNKGIVLFIALFLICIGVSVTQSSVSPQAFHAAFYLLIMNAAVGIALPLTFKDFVDSSSELENEISLFV